MRYSGHEVALNLPVFYERTGKKEYTLAGTGWMSAPAVAVSKGGRIWMTINMGGTDEGASNMFTVSKSDDDGLTWDEAVFAVDHPDEVRIHEPLVWSTPDGRIYLSWIQSYQWWDGRGGLWLAEIMDADGDKPYVSEPYRLCDGVMANPPMFLSDKKWVLPISKWKAYRSEIYDVPEEQFSMMVLSKDGGRTAELIGKADVPERTFDENNIVRLSDGRYMMLVRTEYGWACSYSVDNGQTWTAGIPYKKGPSAKSCLRMLPDGRLIWATYDTETSVRERIAVWISDDDGKTWGSKLLLDARENVSYPNMHICLDGTVYITHDYDRYGAKEAVLHKVTIKDIEAGKLVDSTSYIGRKVMSK